MLKSFISAFLVAVVMLFAQNSQAQSVSITEVDPGPYTPGSSIAVRIALPANACFDKTNVFSLYLSDATGNFTTQTLLGRNSGLNFNGSFATFINGTIPLNTSVGAGYRVRVVTSNVVTTSAPSAAFAIIPGPAVIAGATTTPILTTAPDTVFGNCLGMANSLFTFQSRSNANTLVTSVRLINDNTGVDEAYPIDLNQNGNATAINTTNFTVFVKAQGAISVGTRAYVLANNVTKTNFGSLAQGPVCLTTVNGVTSASAAFFTDITTTSGLQYNYPGMLYTINWGDGKSDTFTFCQIKSASGNFLHNYTQSSCGKANNAYSVSFAATLPFCNNIAPFVTSQAVLAPPTNNLTGPTNVCTNTTATWTNTSSPGQSVNGTGAACTDVNARYSWLVDGVVKQSGTAVGSTFTWKFTTHGKHTIAIHYDNSNTVSCTPADKVLDVCVQDAPVAKFTLSTNTVCNPGSVNVTDASTVDNICNSGYTYKYTVTPSTGFTQGGTAMAPVYNFTTAGKYTVQLQITPPTGAICPSNIYTDTIYVNGPPVAKLSADFAVCGTGKTYIFDATAGSPTQTTLTGTFQTLPTTYNWTVTGGAYTFVAGTAASKYPTIKFNDFATYTVTVTQTNGCSVSTSAPQHITFQNAPTIVANIAASPICPNGVATLTSVLSDPSLAKGLPKWTSSGTGTFSDPDKFNSSYQPSAADVKAGSVMLTISQNTTLTGTCSVVSDTKVLNIYPQNDITSPASQSICNGSSFSYTITSTVSGSTYTWTATGSANATGYASGSGTTIADAISSTTPTIDATVTYTITPHASGCDGTPFKLTVTISAMPTLTANAASTNLCSNSPAGITLSSNLAAATITWTASASAGTVTGFNQHATPSQETQISDVLVNAGTAPATVTYIIVAHNGSCTAQQTVTLTVQPALSVTATTPASVCSGSPAGIVLNSNLPTTFYTWTATSSSADITGFTTNTSPTGNATINDVLVNKGPAAGTVTYVITPTANGCTGSPVTKTITVNPVPVITATAASSNVCSNSPTAISLSSTVTATKYTWTVTGAGTDVSGFSAPTSPATTTAITDKLVNKGTSPVTITYTITGHNDNCDSQPVAVDITVQPLLTVSGTAPGSVCSNDQSNINLKANLTGTTYTWTATASDPAILSGFSANSTPTTNNQIQQQLSNNGTVTVSVTYVITAHNNGCDATALTYVINVAPLPTITATPQNQAICNGQTAVINLTSNLSTTKYTWTATTTATGVKGYSSQNAPAQTTSIQQTLVNNGTSPATVTYTITAINGGTANNCTGNSVSVTVTIQPSTATANAGADDKLCGATTYQLNGNDLGPGATGTWTVTSGQTGISFADATLYNTAVNGLVPGQVYTFRWTSKGAAPCADSFDEVIISDQVADIRAAFTTDKNSGCDKIIVNFTNTSTPATGVTYLWNFGNGATSTLQSPPAQTYITQSNGKDSVYTVTLKVGNACTVNTYTQTITVKPSKPVVSISPDKTLTCAPFTLNVQNLSPGTNQSYTFYLTDANGTLITKNVKTDKSDQQFLIPSPGNYKVYMIAQSECGTAQTPTYTIAATANNATPRLLVNGTEGTGCVPLTVTFHNNSTGTTGYRYDWGDGTSNLVTTSSGDVTHTFTKGGTYSVTLHASNGCTADIAAAPIQINVLYQPTVAFTPDVTIGCKTLKVHFKNATTDPSTSELQDLKYDWDFGDGSPHSAEVNPTHVYDYKHSPYTVTLTATNATGCPATLTKDQLIVVNQSALTDFVAKPDSVIKIPDYSFSFTDLTTGNPVSWKWSFGDGATSTQRNPDHTYADTGLYKVTLTASNIYCDSTKVHYVRITGVPGQLYLPNAFMPNSMHEELRTFVIKGSGLKEWRLQIFNNYGQLLWETTKLDDKGRPVESWDGTFNGQPLPQGVYVWQATGTFINGNEWKGMSYNGSPPKHTGVIHLLK